MPTHPPLVRVDATARTTGTRVFVIDTQHPDNDLDPSDGRWATVCDGFPTRPHGGVVNHRTLALARGHSAHPEEWCEYCLRGGVDITEEQS